MQFAYNIWKSPPCLVLLLLDTVFWRAVASSSQALCVHSEQLRCGKAQKGQRPRVKPARVVPILDGDARAGSLRPCVRVSVRPCVHASVHPASCILHTPAP